MPPPPLAASELLPVFARHGVNFIVVGAVAAVAAGAPILTKDVDLLFDGAETNLERILAACVELKATYKDPAGRHLEPSLSTLRSFRLHLLQTSKGEVDLLREIGDGWAYLDMLERSREVELGSVRVRILELEAVIASKRFANRDKDRAVMPVLLETLRLQKLKSGG
ncbi:MAG: nucleotidyltransferase [Thermoanaerobaculia bacterium]